LQRVVVSVNHALFELDDGIVGNLDASWTNLGAASRNVAVLNTEFFLDFRNSVFRIKGVHFVLR
jgi:hypothetical protein